MTSEPSKAQQAFNVMREQYARDWSRGHAERLSADGHYSWMAAFLAGRNLLLEIGTGDGSGTLALVGNGAVVVSIEKNPYCLEMAKKNLLKSDVPVVTVSRGRLVPEGSQSPDIFLTRWWRKRSRVWVCCC